MKQAKKYRSMKLMNHVIDTPKHTKHLKVQILLYPLLYQYILASCSAKNSSSGDNSTTAVTDAKGEMHYYKTVTEKNGKTVTDSKSYIVYAEIMTDENKSYDTKEYSTVFYGKKKEIILQYLKQIN